MKLLNSHAKTPRRKENQSSLSASASWRLCERIFFINNDMQKCFDVTLARAEFGDSLNCAAVV
jgi:hypothetical protein